MTDSHSQSQGPVAGAHHNHGHSHGETDFVSAIRDQFDKMAPTYDDPDKVDFAKKAVAAMLKAYDFKAGETTVLDFACGTGLIARELLPHVAKVVGVDISRGMVDQFNARVRELGFPEDKISAIVKDVTRNSDDMAQKYDVVVCSMSYRFIEALNKTTSALKRTLKPNGIFFIIDVMVPAVDTPANLLTEEYNHHIDHRQGFDEKAMRRHYEAAGFVDVQYRHALSFKFQGQDLDAFIASGRVPVD